MPADDTPAVNAKAVLIDPASLSVLWMNESACHDLEGEAGESVVGLPVERAVPMAEMLGVPEALRSASVTGEPRHLRADLVSTRKGRMSMVASVYRLPDGKLLLLVENAWQAEERNAAASRFTRSARRRR